MTRVLITGMSGTGKSSVIARLAALGHEAIDADGPDWSAWASMPQSGAFPGSPPELDWVWREDRIRDLLDRPRHGPLFIGGCAPNQGTFYDRFDHVVLLRVPTDVLLDRLATRTSNQFGKAPEERTKILHDLETVEPLLRRGADIEIDTSAASLDEVVDLIAALGEG